MNIKFDKLQLIPTATGLLVKWLNPPPFLARCYPTPRELEFKCTLEDFEGGKKRYDAGERTQDAFHFLTADEREFLMSGLKPEEFNALFPEE